MTQFQVHAWPWPHGWELHIEGIGVTQVDDLAHAEQQVRDFVATELGEQEAGLSSRASVEASIDIQVHRLNA